MEVYTLGATHWAALHAAAAASVAAGSRDDIEGVAKIQVPSLLLFARACPSMVTAGFLKPARLVLEPLAQVSSQAACVAAADGCCCVAAC